MTLAFSITSQFIQALIILAVAPLLLGWVNQCRAWLQNKRGAGMLQPYRNFAKLFAKDAVLAHNASPLFRAVPYLLFGCMALAAGIVPIVATDLPFARSADVIALVGIFALARVFLALAAMDVGTAFGTLGARREMLIAFLAEPALLMVFFTASLISQSTSLNTIVASLSEEKLAIYPSLAFAAIAFVMVLLAENARIPIDNPSTHLELTMVHEAMILEYSARHLALVEWASSIKLMLYVGIGLCLFVPWGIAGGDDFTAFVSVWNWTNMSIARIFAYPIAILWLAVKLLIAGAGLALLEAVSAKMRLFRAPEFLGTAFLFAVLGMLVHFLLEGDINLSLASQLVNFSAALLLLIGFAMLSQRRIVSLVNLFATQGFVLGVSTLIVAYSTGQTHLVYSALLTLTLKVIALPFLLHRLIERLHIRSDVETLINIPTTMIAGIALVVFAFNLALPISQLSGTIIRSTLGIALACVLLSFLMMLTRRKAVPQMIGFLALENGLLFAATSATYGMPMAVELGIALDVLIGALILGVFFFQIRETFDSLDLKHMEQLKDEPQESKAHVS